MFKTHNNKPCKKRIEFIFRLLDKLGGRSNNETYINFNLVTLFEDTT